MSIRNESPKSNSATFDVDLELKDAGLVASSAAAEVDSSAKILDLGAGKVAAKAVIDVTALEIASNDELYTVIVELSNSATFASGIVAGASIQFGAQEVILGATDTDSTTGRYELPFTNVLDDTHYRYARLYTVVAGSVATGINYKAYAAIA
jgi:hypothetical protein